MTSKIPATATMLVKNSERYLSEVLTALDGFDEILLLDNGSTDRWKSPQGSKTPASANTNLSDSAR